MRPINEIASDILKAWPKPHITAQPYLAAMRGIDSIQDTYGRDSAKSIVLYFLSNASTFRGEQAKALKAELKQHLK